MFNAVDEIKVTCRYGQPRIPNGDSQDQQGE